MPLSPRQEEILDATLHLVQERGLGGLTIRRLAEQVGVTEGALYRHFPGKTEIILGLIDRLEQRLFEPMQRIAEETSTPPRARLRRLLRHHATVVSESDSLPILLLAEVVASGEAALIARMERLFTSYLALLEQLLGEQNGEQAPLATDQAALALLGVVSAFAIKRRLTIPGQPLTPPPAEAIDFLVDRLTRKKR